MPEPLLLFVTLNGVNYPLASCRWLRIAPSGCVTDQLPGDAVTNPAAAAAAFTRNRRDRQREHNRGVRYQLADPEQWRIARYCLTGDCTHQNAA